MSPWTVGFRERMAVTEMEGWMNLQKSMLMSHSEIANLSSVNERGQILVGEAWYVLTEMDVVEYSSK